MELKVIAGWWERWLWRKHGNMYRNAKVKPVSLCNSCILKKRLKAFYLCVCVCVNWKACAKAHMWWSEDKLWGHLSF